MNRKWLGLSVLALIVMASGVWAHKPAPPEKQPASETKAATENSMMVLVPYKHKGTWVFDDADRGLVKEAFVAGIPKMIEQLVKDIPNAEKGFRLIFSSKKFPGYDVKLDWRRGDKSGNWYYSEKYKVEGWLCPALFKYFKEAPKTIYVKAEAKK